MTKALLALSILLSSQAHAALRNCRLTDEVRAQARQYMIDNNLIEQGEEADFPELGIQLRWGVMKVYPRPNACYVVMSICTIDPSATECNASAAVEVLGYKDRKIVPFEELHPVPGKVVARIGSNPHDKNKDLSFYYALLNREDALAAYKSFVTDTPYGGFSGIAVRGVKADYDPTPNRDWGLVGYSRYSLRRGMTAEVLDIQAWQLDGLDGSGSSDGYWSGCMNGVENMPNTCQVAPWGQAFIRELIPYQ